jgi:7,8-dihydropterin-6-yl-methyl-4-(beta-D-ribofuranosyl)aminobenzene 5'-phosphate synthase
MIQLRCLVDNMVTRSSELWGEHGVSFLIETEAGSILFDTGQSGDVLLHNARVMGVNLKKIEYLVFSHAHYDHTGGLNAFLANCSQGIPLYANPDLFQERFSVKDGRTCSIGLKTSRAELEKQVELHLNAGPVEILPGVWTTGEILERPDFEGRGGEHQIRVNGEWQTDPYRDDLSLVLETGGGLALICGCCHAGLLNTLAHVQRIFQKEIKIVIGGTHLTSAKGSLLEYAVDVLWKLNDGTPPRLYLNHCTGERAYLALAQVFGECLQPFPAGAQLSF